MSLNVLTANHRAFDTSELEVIAQRANDIAPTLANCEAIAGYVLLSTCNRVEFYLDCDTAPVHTVAADLSAPASHPIKVLSGSAAARHLYEVAAGLDSMVVGEREIVGQLRQALDTARSHGTTTKLLESLWRGALHMARRISTHTDISSTGRSIVDAALDMAMQPTTDGAPIITDWENTAVLLVGTGAYAGATVAALHSRGAANIAVYSASGRAQPFAQRHGILPAHTLDLTQIDIAILCRGTGSPILTEATLRGVTDSHHPLILIDLARSHDVDVHAHSIHGVRLINLDSIRFQVPPLATDTMTQVQAIVEESLAELDIERRERAMDPVIAGINSYLSQLLDAERNKFSENTSEDSADALRALEHFASVLTYRCARAARSAAVSERAEEFHQAAQLVFGIDLPAPISVPSTLDPLPTEQKLP